MGFTNHHKTDLLTHEHTKPCTIDTVRYGYRLEIGRGFPMRMTRVRLVRSAVSAQQGREKLGLSLMIRL
ncbi:MAG: hypothetical protein K9N21_03965 [Deltaproteobacteria bacterium]|nr:hypothetical protein [Deltaproteobacteria bacterium]